MHQRSSDQCNAPPPREWRNPPAVRKRCCDSRSGGKRQVARAPRCAPAGAARETGTRLTQQQQLELLARLPLVSTQLPLNRQAQALALPLFRGQAAAMPAHAPRRREGRPRCEKKLSAWRFVLGGLRPQPIRGERRVRLARAGPGGRRKHEPLREPW